MIKNTPTNEDSHRQITTKSGKKADVILEQVLDTNQSTETPRESFIWRLIEGK